MKLILTAFFWGVIAVATGVLGIVAFYDYPNAPFGLHRWAPAPAVCAGYYCVTYAEWGRINEKNGLDGRSEEILTALVLDKATRIVAYYEKIRISDAEAAQAGSAAEKTINAIPGGKNMLNEVYGGDFAAFLTKDRVAAILLREKLSAKGITSPWSSKYSPIVTVWNASLRWDAANKRVVRK